VKICYYNYKAKALITLSSGEYWNNCTRSKRSSNKIQCLGSQWVYPETPCHIIYSIATQTRECHHRFMKIHSPYLLFLSHHREHPPRLGGDPSSSLKSWLLRRSRIGTRNKSSYKLITDRLQYPRADNRMLIWKFTRRPSSLISTHEPRAVDIITNS